VTRSYVIEETISKRFAGVPLDTLVELHQAQTFWIEGAAEKQAARLNTLALKKGWNVSYRVKPCRIVLE